jgi:hypothetical protein
MKKGAANAPILSADVKNDKPKEISQDAKSRNVQTGRAKVQFRNFSIFLK